MAGLWYRTGTVTLTTGSKNVTGYGTKWKSANPLPGKGSMLCGPDGKLYEVDIVADDTTMTLVSAYQGTSGPGQGYALVLMSLTIPQFSTQLSQFVAKNSLFTSQINKLLTATGDVQLTDPDTGLVVTVPSWSKVTSEGEGQAARAKIEADKAAANAAAAEAAARESMMPCPDIWSPLTSNLTLITGKGKEIKVGDEVVSRRWEFERLSQATERQRDGKLRLVANNEPRFENGALLKERGSTNLYFPHDGSGSSATRGTVEVTAGSGLLGESVTTKFREDMELGGHYLNLRSISGLTAGDDVSITVELIPLRAGMDSIRLGSNDMTVNGTVVNITPDQVGKPLQIVHRSTMLGSVLRSFVWGFVGGGSAWQGNGSLNFEILSVQVEKGSATSLIPTTTVAATRAAESVWLPGPANNPGYGKSRTFAVEFELIGASLTGYTPIICDGAYPTRTFLCVWSDGTLMANNDYVKAYSSPVLKKRNHMAASFDYDGGYVTYSLNNGPVIKSTVPCTVQPNTPETAWTKFEIGALGAGGHQSSLRIRNIRGWFRSASEAQLRALR